jgi:hypothetical protein
MVGLTFSADGKLLSFYAVPGPPAPPEEANVTHHARQKLLFAAAGLDPIRFTEVPTRSVPPVAFDSRGAWDGVAPDDSSRALHVEAAYWQRRPVYFEMADASAPPERAQDTQPAARAQIGHIVTVCLLLITLMAGALLTRYNMRAGRADQRGARHLAGFVFSLEMLLWVFGGSHVPTFWEAELLVLALSRAAYAAGLLWLMYMGLEPFVRRRWPHALVSWSRVLAGRFRDPLVGGHVLTGAVCGVTIALLSHSGVLWNNGARLSGILGVPSMIPLFGGRHVVRQFIYCINDAVGRALLVLFLICVLRVIVAHRNEVALGFGF